MNDSTSPTTSSLQIEYLDDIAIVNAAGDLRGRPPELFEVVVNTAPECGYSLLLFDFYDNQGIDDEGIAGYISALAVIESSEKEAEFAIVQHRGSRRRA